MLLLHDSAFFLLSVLVDHCHPSFPFEMTRLTSSWMMYHHLCIASAWLVAMACSMMLQEIVHLQNSPYCMFWSDEWHSIMLYIVKVGLVMESGLADLGLQYCKRHKDGHCYSHKAAFLWLRCPRCLRQLWSGMVEILQGRCWAVARLVFFTRVARLFCLCICGHLLCI